MKQLQSFQEVQGHITGSNKSFLLLYKSGSKLSECALSNLQRALTEQVVEIFFTVDVSQIRDVHPVYGITSVPSLLVFDKGELSSVIKGCHDSSYFRTIAENAAFIAKAEREGKSVKRVTVYSTPTCSWCNTLKSWLRKNSVPYTDVDVSRDQHAAEELVRRTGQQGVPQTDINGQIVVGFNQVRLMELLEL